MLIIVLVVSVVWDILIAVQIKTGSTFPFSSQKWEPPRRRVRAVEPRQFWTAIGLQLVFPNAAIAYLLWFALSPRLS